MLHREWITRTAFCLLAVRHVGGTVGLEVGLRMRRGTIVIGGVARDFAGLQMKGGTIVLLNGAEIRTGAWMTRGTIVSLKSLQLMPTFSYVGRFQSNYLNLFQRYLEDRGVVIPVGGEGHYERYSGDNAVPGKGEILQWVAE